MGGGRWAIAETLPGQVSGGGLSLRALWSAPKEEKETISAAVIGSFFQTLANAPNSFLQPLGHIAVRKAFVGMGVENQYFGLFFEDVSGVQPEDLCQCVPFQPAYAAAFHADRGRCADKYERRSHECHGAACG